MELLRETDRSVTEICFDVGFASLGTFSRTFREVVGESPSRYRARFTVGGRRVTDPGLLGDDLAAPRRLKQRSFGEARPAEHG